MQNSRKIQDILITGIISCCGLGFFPKGSGTVASFFALGFWSFLYLIDVPRVGVIAICIAIMFIGNWATQIYEKRTGSEDSSVIVIDEWVGMGISLWPVKMELGYLVAAFFLFRLFDIWKPPGVRYFDRNHLNSWGVMLDDVVAGLYAAGILGIYRWLH